MYLLLFLSHVNGKLKNLQCSLIMKIKKFASLREELALTDLLWNARGFKSLARKLMLSILLILSFSPKLDKKVNRLLRLEF